jgi:electron transfer flavoprotein alpha subunit
MSVLVYIENWDGRFKKLSYELASYASALGDLMGTPATALSIGNVENDELNRLGKYGIGKILAVRDDRLKVLDNAAYSSILAETAVKEGAVAVILANNFTGKALSPRVSVRLKAGLVNGVVNLPLSVSPFVVKKKVFSGKAFASIEIKTPVRVLTLSQNSFGLKEKEVAPSIENFTPQLPDSLFSTEVKEVRKVTGKVLLTDAEIVVSGGRGMKGPEHWGPLEELASLLGGATACSRPVSDEGWRPHEEHTGQTGKIIAPNLYIACGISGAIQHLAGVSSSKFMVAINKDPEAPVFEAADYGIVGDVHKVLPELIKAVREFKAEQ